MKVIDGKHYVDGGPVCDGGGNAFLNCKGTGRFIIAPGAPLDTTANQIGVDEPCSYCHGTGVLPVEEWSDTQKADWLRSQVGKGKKHGSVFIYHEWRFTEGYWQIGLDNHKYGESDDFSEALTLTVIKVAEEKEKEVTK